MIKVFIDASVLVAASASKTGASALILGLSRQKRIQSFASLAVIGEARKNINLKLAEIGKQRLKTYLKEANLELVSSPSPEEMALCEKVINAKDAPILAAFLKSPASFLVTLDRKHFLVSNVIKFIKPKKVFLPGEFIETL